MQEQRRAPRSCSLLRALGMMSRPAAARTQAETRRCCPGLTMQTSCGPHSGWNNQKESTSRSRTGWPRCNHTMCWLVATAVPVLGVLGVLVVFDSGPLFGAGLARCQQPLTRREVVAVKATVGCTRSGCSCHDCYYCCSCSCSSNCSCSCHHCCSCCCYCGCCLHSTISASSSHRP